MVLDATQLAKKYGFQVRYYMMAGNRGETLETFQQSLDFIKEAQPHEVTIANLAIYPGTEEFDIFQENGGEPEIFFQQDFISLERLAGMLADGEEILNLKKNISHRNVLNYTAKELETILGRLPNHSAIHMDLAGAYYRGGHYDKAEKHVRIALEMNYPLPGLAFNYLACIAAGKQDFSNVMGNLIKAYKFFPHEVVLRNMKLLAHWHKEGGLPSGRPLILMAHNLFETILIFQQPETPGPIRLSVNQGEKIFNLGQYSNQAYHQGEPLHIQS